jgi:hypothetical protein
MALHINDSGLNSMARVTRAGDWWDYKLIPILMVFYASAARLDIAIGSLWIALITLLGALIPGAVYVSLINDITDIADDAAAGKANWLIGRTRTPAILGILACLAAGGAFGWHMRAQPLLLGLYGGSWIAFTLYSLPPFRFKARGVAGIISDTSGANLLPVLFAAAIATNVAGAEQDWLWLSAVGGWAFAYGLRGILWHQLVDAEADHIGGVGTFVQRHGPKAAQRLGKWIAAPLELGTFALICLQIGTLAPLIALGLYGAFVVAQLDLFEMNATLVEPKPRPLFIGQRYYDLFLPIALLVGSAVQHPIDYGVLIMHMLIFPQRPLQFVNDIMAMKRCAQARK